MAYDVSVLGTILISHFHMMFYWIQSSTEENSQSEKKYICILGLHFIPKLRKERVKIRSVINIHAAVTVTNLITYLCASDMN